MFINNIRYFLSIAICRAIAYILLKVIFNICTNLFITDIFLCTFFYFRKRLKTKLANILHTSLCQAKFHIVHHLLLRFVVQISPFLEDFLNIFVFPRHIRHLFKNLYNQFSPLATFQGIFQ